MICPFATGNGTFDGNGHTIKNLTIRTENTVSSTYSSGLVGWNQGKVKNLTVDDATIADNHNVGVSAGAQEFGFIENCTVKNATITAAHYNDDLCGDKMGGIVGNLMSQNTGVVCTNCTVENSAITVGRDAGQIAGYSYDVSDVADCTIDNVTMTPGFDCTGANMGGLVGRHN